MITQSIIDIAKKEAEKSNYRFKVGCVIFKGKKIISKGHNYAQRGCNKIRKKFLKWSDSIHAEIDAIIKAKKDLKNFSLLVVRINNNGKLMMAKPCAWCSMYIEHVRIKTVYYSTSKYPYIEKIKL